MEEIRTKEKETREAPEESDDDQGSYDSADEGIEPAENLQDMSKGTETIQVPTEIPVEIVGRPDEPAPESPSEYDPGEELHSTPRQPTENIVFDDDDMFVR